VDGGLQVLLVAGLIRAQDERGQVIDPKDLERKSVGKTMFKVESTTVTTAQRIQIRKVLQKVGFTVTQGEELAHVPQFLQKLQELANKAGRTMHPNQLHRNTKILSDIRLTAGNEQLLAIYNSRDELTAAIDSWTELSEHIDKRWPSWTTLKRLAGYTNGIQDAEVILSQVSHIERERQLLEVPDPIAPLIANLTQLLRDELNRLDKEYQGGHEQGMARLKADENWQKLEPEQRNSLLASQKLTLADQPKVALGSTDEILQTLAQTNLSMFADRVAAMPGRFDRVALAAAELCVPEAQLISVPRRTIKTEADIDAWVTEVKQRLTTALQTGRSFCNRLVTYA